MFSIYLVQTTQTNKQLEFSSVVFFMYLRYSRDAMDSQDMLVYCRDGSLALCWRARDGGG